MSVLGRQLATAYGRLIRGDVFDAMETLLVELLALARWPAVDAGLSWGGFRISAG